MGSQDAYEYRYQANEARLWQRKDNVSGEEVTYQYDELGRLAAATTTGPEFVVGL
jgi:YD repeat-containing protein